MWLKYDAAEIVLDRRKYTQEPCISEYQKPRGFWITDDTEHCWRRWVLENTGDDWKEGLTHRHEVTLDESEILILRTAFDLDLFTKDYSTPASISRGRPGIGWLTVAKKWKGVIITPYQWARSMEYSWYSGWDCASGCIWDVSAIRSVRLIEVTNEKTPTPDQTISGTA